MTGLTDLQLILIAGGIALILFIVIYNRIRANRLRKVEMAKQLEKQTQDTPCVSGKNSQINGDKAHKENDALIQAENAHLKKEWPIDEIIECVITITPETDIAAEELLPLLQSWSYAGQLPVRFIGRIEHSDDHNGWHVICPSHRYCQLKVCVLLANRQMVLTDIAFSSLIAQLNLLTSKINAEMDVPDMMTVIAQAQALYQFISTHDLKIRLTIQANTQPWPKTWVEKILEKKQYQPRSDGIWIKNDREEDEECELFLVGIFGKKDSETALGLIFNLDVPCVPREKDPFGQMVACAKNLCEELEGRLIDEQGNLLTDKHIAVISEQLEQYYQVMQAASLHAGSLRSLRLFHQ